MESRLRGIVALIAIGIVADAAAGEGPQEIASDLHASVVIEADGKPIDVGDGHGHAGPCVFDVDQDGRRDLVVGRFRGDFLFFRNVGADDDPKYEAAGNVMAGSKPAWVHIYCCIGSSPQFADIDGDGFVDLVSGSYDPGAVYLFRGQGNGEFAAFEGSEPSRSYFDKIYNRGEPLKDRSGRVILSKPDQREEWESFGSWPFLMDWDADGDLDLVMGGFDGSIQLRRNEGNAKEYAFSETPLRIEADGEPIRIRSEKPGLSGHAAVVIADWNADGKFDLISGCGDGSVHWFRNIGVAGEPQFTSGGLLVPPAHDGSGFLEPGELPPPGIRTQPAVADINSDGKLDLLVGDFYSARERREDLTPAQVEQFERVKATFLDDLAKYSKVVQQAQEKGREFLQQFPEEDRVLSENQEKWREFMEEQRSKTEYDDAKRSYERSKKGLQYYLKPSQYRHFVDGVDEAVYEIPHGLVRLYLRR